MDDELSSTENRKEIDGQRDILETVATRLGHLRTLKSLNESQFPSCAIGGRWEHSLICQWGGGRGGVVLKKGHELEYANFEVECSGVDAHHHV